VIARGASGGMGSGNYERGRSKGSTVTTVVYLQADQPLHILVGQEGGNGPEIKPRKLAAFSRRFEPNHNESAINGAGGGGGGGTFIFQVHACTLLTIMLISIVQPKLEDLPLATGPRARQLWVPRSG
jgi:hypothetical protein